MAVQATILSVEVSPRITNRVAKLVFSGNYTQAASGNGEGLNLTPSGTTPLLNTDRIDAAFSFSRIPRYFYTLSDSGGYYLELIPGTINGLGAGNHRVKVFQPAGTELAGGAYPAALSAPTSPFIVGFVHTTGV